MYTFLMEGCVLPSVTALQILLNRTRKDNKIQVDGIFGPVTRSAVVDFQRMKRIQPDGIVGSTTWPLLTEDSGLKVIDTVDSSDPGIQEVVTHLIMAGFDPITLGHMSGGVSVVVSRVLARAAQSGGTVLLRITGHGGPGHQYLTGGRVLWLYDKSGHSLKIEDVKIISNRGFMKDNAKNIVARRDKYGNWRDSRGQVVAWDTSGWLDETMLAVPLKNYPLITPRNRRDPIGVNPILGRLRTVFARFGSVELHGCSVGAGALGHSLLRRLSSLLGVPVSAALRMQSLKPNFPFRFQGPVVTATPFGGDLKGWSKIVAESE